MLFRRKKSSSSNLTPAEAARRAGAGELVLVDVREPGERAEERPEPSLHIPLKTVGERLGELPSDRPVAFICRSGARSSIARKQAADAGLEAANVRGGMLAWTQAGLATAHGPETKERHA